jgi:hypothetical protein
LYSGKRYTNSATQKLHQGAAVLCPIVVNRPLIRAKHATLACRTIFSSFELLKHRRVLRTSPFITLRICILPSFSTFSESTETGPIFLFPKCINGSVLVTHVKCPWFQAPAAMLTGSVLFWDITQHRVVFLYRRFGTTYWSHIQWSRNQRRLLVCVCVSVCDITQHRVVFLYRRFGTTYWSHIKWSRNQRRLLGLLEASAKDYHSTLRIIPVEYGYQVKCVFLWI